jgi:hypothetical protein
MESLEERVETIERILRETASARKVGPLFDAIDSELSQIKARLETLEAKR